MADAAPGLSCSKIMKKQRKMTYPQVRAGLINCFYLFLLYIEYGRKPVLYFLHTPDMPKKSLLISFLTILLLLLTLFTFMNTSKAMPAFSGNTQQGNAFNSSTLQGKVTLINFWATSCTGCVREVPALIQLQNDLNKTGFQVIGIALNYDEPAYIAKFVDKFGVNYPVIHDNTGSIADGFGKVTLAPTSFLIDSKGKIIKKYVGEVDIAVLKKEISGLQKNS